MVKTKIWSLVLAILVAWFALPAPAWAESKLELARIRSGVLPGAVIGGHYEGWLKILQQHYTATGQFDEQFEDSLRYLVEEELSQAGFEVVRSQPYSVFEESVSEDLEPARFLLGGTITQVKFNSYSSWFSSLTQDQRTLRWEVFDRDRQKVIYRQTTSGSAEVEGINNPAATYEAIRASLQALLVDSRFKDSLEQSPTDSPLLSVAAKTYAIPAIASAHQPLTVEQIASRAIPAIVRIRTPSGRGSGFLIDASGLVLTNQHVVDSAFSVKVDLYDDSTRVARVLKRDSSLDAALLQLEGATGLAGLPICHTNAVRVGEGVIAIGSPLSLHNSVTQGIISGVRLGSRRSLIQTDTAINPGNSGGPLLNRQGAVIGIVTEKVASKGVEGLGFALPIADVLQRLQVQVRLPNNAKLDACGNPIIDSLPTLKVTDHRDNGAPS